MSVGIGVPSYVGCPFLKIHSMPGLGVNDSAALMQAVWRMHRARCRVAALAARAYEKHLDPSGSGYEYYYNPRTGFSSWAMPALMVARSRGALPRKTFTEGSASLGVHGVGGTELELADLASSLRSDDALRTDRKKPGSC